MEGEGTRPPSPRVRVLVADDHPVVRLGIVGMLLDQEDLEVVGQAHDGAEAISLAEELGPDVVLMDLRMPVLDGVEATRRIASRTSGARVVVLTTYDTDGDILRAVEAGAIGYLLKDSPRNDILAAVRAAAVGRSALSPAVSTRLVGAARSRGAAPAAGRRAGTMRSGPVAISPRERQVLAAVARGLSNSQIGRELFITEATVKTHLLRVYGKLGVDTRTAAVTEALRRGLLDLG
ncbi:response regulator transcription factor [Actinomyces bowdenii]|uniref:Response regulator transcription factor n=1 Tax=Actinomyces bowdenii TaxID=131109 RepID=A0A853EPQ0_9ACTO|nr:response regulator transcription factor [Actinomyces bowdenii]MBF0697958.1 response regulator transcription factor [Actinomyces bowdenii]NYS70131.1 response regulator transcription factor [Actinomyces bowdenii]